MTMSKKEYGRYEFYKTKATQYEQTLKEVRNNLEDNSINHKDIQCLDVADYDEIINKINEVLKP